MATSTLQGCFSCRRIGAARQREALLLLFFGVSVLPFVLLVSLWVSHWTRILLARLLGPAGKTIFGDAVIFAAILLVAMLSAMFLRRALSSRRFASLVHARELSQQEAPAWRIAARLASAAGIPVPHLRAIDGTNGINAFSFGLSQAETQIFITSGMLEVLSPEEIEGVLAHEISHIANRETRLNSMTAALLFFLKIPALLLARVMRAWTRFRGRLVKRGDHEVYYMRFWAFRIPLGSYRAGTSISLFWMLLSYIYFGRWLVPAVYRHSGGLRAHALQGLIMLLPFFMLVVAPRLANFIRPILTRGQELEADADAVLLTGTTEGLLRALIKIESAGLTTIGVNPMVAHLYFADPRGGVEGEMASGNLFASRPGLAKRIEFLEELGGKLRPWIREQAQMTASMFADRHYRAGITPEATGEVVDELAFAPPSHTAGRTFRLLGAAEVYEMPDTNSRLLETVGAGSLIIGMEFTGNFRQVITKAQNFGYLARSVRVQELAGLAMDAFERGAEAAAEIPVPPPPHPALRREQKIVALLFAAAVFVAGFVVLTLAGR